MTHSHCMQPYTRRSSTKPPTMHHDSPLPQKSGSSSLTAFRLYGATLQLAYNASEPAWSKDGWSFMPLDIRNVQNTSSFAQDMTLDSVQDQELSLDAALVNVTVPTVATRARLECSPFKGISNLSAWVTEVHLTNSTRCECSQFSLHLSQGGWSSDPWEGPAFPSFPVRYLPSSSRTQCSCSSECTLLGKFVEQDTLPDISTLLRHCRFVSCHERIRRWTKTYIAKAVPPAIASQFH